MLAERAKTLAEQLRAPTPPVAQVCGDAADLIEDLSRQVEKLRLEVQGLSQKVLGRTSEKVSAEQIAFVLDELAAPNTPAENERVGAPGPVPAPLPDAPVLPPPPPRPPVRRTRRPFPATLEREEIILPADMTPFGDRPTVLLGYDVSETLEYTPGTFKVIVYKRERRALKDAPDEGVVRAPAADKLLERGLFGPGALTHLVIAKYLDHTPLHRLHRQWLRESGVDVPVQTLADWVGHAHLLLAPVAERITELIYTAHVLQADGSGLKVLDRDALGGVRLGQMWVLVGDRKRVAFIFRDGYEYAHTHSLFKHRKGWLLVDAHPSYDAVFAMPDATAIEVGCWAHGRRDFVHLLEAGDTRGAPLIADVQALYAIEDTATERGDSHDERKTLRQAESKPILDKIQAWLATARTGDEPKSPFVRACNYLIRHWRALTRFLEDGALPLDNNGAERSIRPLALGRRNYLFAGSVAGAERAATAYTVLGTCVLLGINPRDYLRDVLPKLARPYPRRDIDAFLPDRWAEARTAAQPAPLA